MKFLVEIKSECFNNSVNPLQGAKIEKKSQFFAILKLILVDLILIDFRK